VNTSTPDLHVVSLQYSLKPSERHSYQNPPPVAFERDVARFSLSEGTLTCEMKTHFSTVPDACAAVDPILRAWEVDSDLRHNRGALRFKFSGADIIERSPCPPGVVRGNAYITLPGLTVSGQLSVLPTTSARYPEPPPDGFLLTPDAKSILDRYYGYLAGREPLLAMAYFCLTVIEVICGGGKRQQHRTRALSEYQIDQNVLDTLGTLTSEHGDRLSARKASADNPLTASERAWLDATVKKLIWQLGTPKAARTLLKVSDLPPLP
jgi:hypothetical protein